MTVLVGLLSIWPIIYMGVFMAFMVLMVFSTHHPGGNFPEYFIVVHLLTMMLMFILMTIYVIHVFRTDLVAGDKKVLWLIIIFFGNLVAFPIYWYLYWWRPLRVTPAQPGNGP